MISMRGTIKPLYNRFVRPYTPRKIAVFNGVPVRAVRLFDATDEYPGYEGPLIEAIRTRIRDGDSVAIVGGGRGVSSVVAAERAGKDGRVIAYEGASDRFELARETVRLNAVDEIVSVRHAVVGIAISLADSPGDAANVAPETIPDVDSVVMDCEGAELEILSRLEIDPRVIIVETHGFLDAPESRSRELIEELGYSVVDRSIEDDARGIVVLTAVSAPIPGEPLDG